MDDNNLDETENGAAADEGNTEEAEATSFRQELRARMIVGTPMDAGVRLTFLLGALTLVIAMGVDVVGGFLGPPVATFAGSIPVGALAILTTGQLMVLALFFNGLLQVKRRTRNVALGITTLIGVVFCPPDLIDYALLLPIVGFWVFAATKKQFTQPDAVKPVAIATAAMGLVFVLAETFGRADMLISFSLFELIPAAIGLFLASTDIAEIAQVAGDAATATLRSASASVLVLITCAAALLSCTVAIVFVAHDGTSGEPVSFVYGTGCTPIIYFSLIYWMIVSVGRKRELSVRPHLRYITVFAVVVLCSLAFFTGGTVHMIVDPKTDLMSTNLFSLVEVLVASLSLLVLLTIAFLTWGRRSEDAFVFLGYGSTVSVVWLTYCLNPGDSLKMAPFGVGVGTLTLLLVALIWPKTRSRFSQICKLLIATNLAFSAYALVAGAFGVPSSFEAGTVLQALIVFVALGWDILTSRHVTLNESPAFPRTARVSFFVAFISTVALLVMMTSVIHLHPSSPAEAAPLFESEGYVRLGLYMFGAPMLLYLFAVRMRGILATSVASTARS
jgi:hypothetical protein